MLEQVKFKCLRCGLEYNAPYDPDTEPTEKTCPKCRSNSVRVIKEKKKSEKTETADGGKK